MIFIFEVKEKKTLFFVFPSIKDWRNLYEPSNHSVQSDEEDQKSVTQKPFYLERQPSIEIPPSKTILSISSE